MADPFSIAAGVIGTLAPAVHWIRLLLADVESLADAPQAIENLKGEIRLEVLGTSVLEQSKLTLTACSKSCETFRADILSWTKHSSDGKLSWRDRANLRLFKEHQIKSISEQLKKYRASLTLLASTATLHVSVRHAQMTKDIKAAVSNQTAEIASSITLVDRELVTVNAKLEKLNVSGNNSNARYHTYHTDTHQSEILEQRVALQMCLKLLEVLKSKNEEERERIATKERDQPTTITFGSNNSGFQLGTNTGSISGSSFGSRS
ncbi:hypothetical protein GGS24DRAFT_514378 [Hypoxylon argillaceum]|nr:hypothetical protein GGS24DRAFT_514378 [Hypoxylon argillaceum]